MIDNRLLDKQGARALVLYPEIASEWNYEKNGTMKPSDFTAHSHVKV